MTVAISPLGSAAPYLALLGVIVLVVAAVFIKYPNFRSYHRRRNVLAYTVIILIIGLTAYQAYNTYLGPNDVAFSIQKTETPIYSGQQNHFSVTCNSEGAKDIQFYMVIQSGNATVQTNGEQGYIQMNSTAIKIPFSFHGSGSQTKQVYFTADSNVSSIAFYPSIENQNNSPMLVWVYLSEIQCTYDSASHSFVMADSYPVAVP